MDEDLEGEIQLLTQTGPYSIPVKCLTKKCLVNLDKKKLDFGVLCIGETYRQSALILNAGALSTEYTISPVLLSSSSTLKQKSTAGGVENPQREDGKILATQAEPPNKLAHRSNYSIMTAVEPLQEPDTTTGQGVIPADVYAPRLKSKSTGLITFTEPQDQTVDKQLTSDHEKLDNAKSQDKPETSQRKGQDRSQRGAPEKARPQDKARTKGQGKSGKAQPKSQDAAPSILLDQSNQEQAKPASQDTIQPAAQDATQADSQDTGVGSKDTRAGSKDTGVGSKDEKQGKGVSVWGLGWRVWVVGGNGGRRVWVVGRNR